MSLRTSTPVLADALELVIGDLHSSDGVPEATITEAASRLREQHDDLRSLVNIGRRVIDGGDRDAMRLLEEQVRRLECRT